MPSTISSNDPLTKEFAAAVDAEEKLHQEVLASGHPSVDLAARWHAAQERTSAAFQSLQLRG